MATASILLFMACAVMLGNLEFDPFWGNQDAQGKYSVGDVKIAGNRCEAAVPQGHLVAELQRRGSGWVFADFRYHFNFEDDKSKKLPDADLIRILTGKD